MPEAIGLSSLNSTAGSRTPRTRLKKMTSALERSSAETSPQPLYISGTRTTGTSRNTRDLAEEGSASMTPRPRRLGQTDHNIEDPGNNPHSHGIGQPGPHRLLHCDALSLGRGDGRIRDRCEVVPKKSNHDHRAASGPYRYPAPRQRTSPQKRQSTVPVEVPQAVEITTQIKMPPRG